MRTGQVRISEGQDRPRWRAKLRHRHDLASVPTPDPYQELAAWLEARRWTSGEFEAIEALDLTAYLRGTTHIDLTPTERLRKLAVALEPRMSVNDQPRGWLALERIYAAGRALDPEDAEIEISRAITAEECASCADDRPDLKRRMILAGREAAGRAIELRPSGAVAHHVLGMLDDSSRHGSIETALTSFERAIALDPDFGWARLYRAHCLHDLGRWPEAARAYSEVDPSFLVGPSAWRYDLLREQRAWCLLQAGAREQALAELLFVLHRYELQPALAKHQLLKELTAAAEGPLRAELSNRFAQLRRKIDTASGVEEPEGE